MLKSLFLVAAMSLSSIAAHATQSDTAMLHFQVEPPHNVATDLNLIMTVAFVCKDQIGIAHYQAARQMAVDTISKMTGNSQFAIKIVSSMDTRFKNSTLEVAKAAKHANPVACLTSLSDYYFRLQEDIAK